MFICSSFVFSLIESSENTVFSKLLRSAELSFGLDIEGGSGCRWSERSGKGIISEGRLMQRHVCSWLGWPMGSSKKKRTEVGEMGSEQGASVRTQYYK